MPNRNTDAQIRARVENFVDELTGLIREAALEAVQEAILRDAGGRGPTRRKSGTGRTAKKRGRRSRSAFDAATVLAAIQSNPGTRTEIIAKGLGTDSKALKSAIDELVETSFAGPEAGKVHEMIDEINRREHTTDDLRMQVIAVLFAHEGGLKPIEEVLWLKMIDLIDDLANYAKKSGNRLRLLIAEK